MSKTNTPAQPLNREGWLTAFAEAVAPIIKSKTGLSVPMSTTRLTCGFPRTRATPNRKTGKVTIGQCVMGHASGLNEIMINPIRDNVISVNSAGEGHGIGATIIHELLHAALPKGTGHKAPFARAAKAMDLQGKPTETHAGPECVKLIKEIADALGPYPHKAIDADWGTKQTTRLLKVMCLDCGYVNEKGNGYTVRVTNMWIENAGLPTCPCGAVMDLCDADGPVEMVQLKPVESSATYLAPGPDGKGTDYRFQIRRTSSEHGGDRWTVIDYGAPVKRMATVDGEQVEVESTNFDATTRIVAAESRQDALDMIDAIREGLFDWNFLLEEDQDDDEGEDDGSNPLADEDPELDRLLYLGDDEDEDPDYPEDQDPGSWTNPVTGKVVHFDYDQVASSREK